MRLTRQYVKSIFKKYMSKYHFSFGKSPRRRIETCKSKYSTAEEIANHLRSTYTDYRRIKSQILIRFVEEALHSTAKPKHIPKPAYSDGDDDGNREIPKRVSKA